ncbi:hypothetical protein LCGC14_1204930 [marine sediment metagenome]|uniref:Uncharacterized protein n=1 Tax=marine sediment metagenome TaxID=412755 RepID=A0A0F9NY80_9ZZZZ
MKTRDPWGYFITEAYEEAEKAPAYLAHHV